MEAATSAQHEPGHVMFFGDPWFRGIDLGNRS